MAKAVCGCESYPARASTSLPSSNGAVAGGISGLLQTFVLDFMATSYHPDAMSTRGLSVSPHLCRDIACY